MTIGVSQSGDYPNTRAWLKKLSSDGLYSNLDVYGQMGLEALRNNTPVDTGLAASSWGYRIEEKKSGPAIIWYNSDIEGGDSVVILVQYGHATRTGGYVQGRDFINPAMAPVFDFILQDIERKVNG